MRFRVDSLQNSHAGCLFGPLSFWCSCMTRTTWASFEICAPLSLAPIRILNLLRPEVKTEVRYDEWGDPI